MAEPGFWDRKELAQKQVEEVSALRNKVGPFLQIERSVDDVGVLKQLADEEPEGDAKAATLAEFGAEFEKVEKQLADFELMQLMSGENDRYNCFPHHQLRRRRHRVVRLGRHAPAHVSALDRAARLQVRTSMDIQLGDEAGIKSATLQGHRRIRLRLSRRPSAACIGSCASRRSIPTSAATPPSPASMSCRSSKTTPHRDQREGYRSRHLPFRRQGRPEREQGGDRRRILHMPTRHRGRLPGRAQPAAPTASPR